MLVDIIKHVDIDLDLRFSRQQVGCDLEIHVGPLQADLLDHSRAVQLKVVSERIQEITAVTITSGSLRPTRSMRSPKA